MTTTGYDVFDNTVQKTYTWIRDLENELHWEDKHRTFQALRSVLHTLRDRLTVEEAANLGAQLPILLRGFYYEGWKPANKPEKMRSKDEFYERVQEELRTDPGVNPDRITKAVLKVLSDHVTEGEIDDVRQMMPVDLRDIWPQG